MSKTIESSATNQESFSSASNPEFVKFAFNTIRTELIKQGTPLENADYEARRQILVTYGNVAAGYDTDPMTLPEPVQLTNIARPEYVGFPIESFPTVLGDAIKAIHENVKLPIEMAAASVLAAASYCAQSHVDVMSPKGTVSPTSLFLLSVGKSGERKSASDNAALKPIEAYQNQLEVSFNNELVEYKKRKAVWDADFKQITHMKHIPDSNDPALDKATLINKLGLEPKHPLNYQIILMDATTEGITTHLTIGQPSLALFLDEGGIFTGGFSMNDENKKRTVGVLSKLWDKGIADRKRKSAEDSQLLKNRRLAAHLLIQPELAEDFLADPIIRTQGILSRYLITWPNSTIGERIIEEYELKDKLQDDTRIQQYNNTILQHLMNPWGTKPDNQQELIPTVLACNDDAERLWRESHNWIEKAQRASGQYSSIQGFASKMLENALRISGVFEYIIQGNNATHISYDALYHALRIMHYYAYQQLTVLGNADLDQETADADALLKWIQNDHQDGIADEITYTTISHFCKPGRLQKSRPLLAKALETLENNSWLIKKNKKRKNGTQIWVIQRP